MEKLKREPSIHITRTNLKKVFKSAGIRKDLVDLVMQLARKHPPINRVILATTQKNRKVASKLVQSTLEDARLFSKVVTMVRRQLNHRGIVQIKEGGRDWLLIKQITELALAFSADFNLTKEKGFQEYIQIALSRLKMFSLNRFPSLHENICHEYQAIERIKLDRHPDKTTYAEKYYTSIILKKTGESPDYKKLPDKYQYFIDIVDAALSSGVDIKSYIDAQFQAFDWASAVPELTQMIGPKAKERLSKYMFKNDIQSNKISKPVIDFSKIIDKDANRSK